MTTFALVGAGPGLGLAAARRFGAAGHRVALLSRSADHLEPLVAELSRDGIEARAYPADVLAPDTLTAALGRAAEELGPVEILQYSPVPRADFMKPVLETTATDLDDPLAFSVKAPVTCVQAVLPGMRALAAARCSSSTAAAPCAPPRAWPAPRSPSPPRAPTHGCCTTRSPARTSTPPS